MRDVHDLQPIIAHRLERRNALAHAVHQYFAAAARDGPQPRSLEISDNLLQRLLKHLAEVDKLARTEAVDVDLRELALHVREQVQIPLLGQLRVMAALHQDLRPAKRERLLDLLVQLVERNDIRVVIFLRAIKGAELAIDVANVGVVDVPIDDIGDDFAAAPVVGAGAGNLASPVGQRAEFFERQMIQPQRLDLVDALSIPDLVQQFVQ
jgi:hypothetical protein